MKNLVKIVSLMICVSSFQANADTLGDIKNFCADKWDGNFKMQKYCIDKQIDGFNSWLGMVKPMDPEGQLYRAVFQSCGHWLDDHNYSMADYCTEKQVEAYNAIQ